MALIVESLNASAIDISKAFANEVTDTSWTADLRGDRGIFTWDGNYYALNLTERLGVEKSGGFLRIGLAHYNTAEEVDRLLEALKQILE